MSQKGHETVKYWNEMKVNTRSTEKLVKIDWTIENISKAIACGSVITGPDFYLQVNCLCTISLEINSNNTHYVFLTNKSNASLKIQKDITILDSNGTVLSDGYSNDVYTLNKNKRANIVDLNYQKSNLSSLKDDKLIVCCILKVIGSVTTKINVFKSEMEPQKTLIDDWKKMYNNPDDADFTLQIGDKVIHAHKTVLIARSAYFRKMFKAEMKEQSENTVLITDVLYPIMLKLVEFLYTGSFTESPDDIQEIFDLYIAADKYDVRTLKTFCGERLIATATTNNICKILQLAHRHGDEELKILAMDFILFHFDTIEKSDGWKAVITSENALASEVWNFCFKHFKNTF